MLPLAVVCKLKYLEAHRQVGRELFCGNAQGFGREGQPAAAVVLTDGHLGKIDLLHRLNGGLLVPFDCCRDWRQVVLPGNLNLAVTAYPEDALLPVAGPPDLVTVDHRSEAALLEEH